MKKMLLIVGVFIVLIFHPPPVSAPWNDCLYIFEAKSINPYETSWVAVCMEESQMDSTAYNKKDPHGGSHGISQIGLKRLEEYNLLTSNHYTVNDLYKVKVSKEIFIYYAHKFGPYETDLMIRRWNGSGITTFDYLKRVKEHFKI